MSFINVTQISGMNVTNRRLMNVSNMSGMNVIIMNIMLILKDLTFGNIARRLVIVQCGVHPLAIL